MQPVSREFGSMNNINTLLNQHQISSLHEIHHHQMLAASQFDPATSHDDFLEQMLSSVPSSAAASFPWAEDHSPPELEEQSAALLAAKLRQHQISHTTAKAMFLQQQLLLSRGLADGGLLPMPQNDQNDVVDGNSFKPPNPMQANDSSVKALFNAFTGSLGHTSNQSQHFHNPQAQNFGATTAAAAPAINQPAVSGSSGGGGGTAGQPRQRVRARRGQATDPHSIAERLRRERIAERMKALQELVPNANKVTHTSSLRLVNY